LFLPKNVEPSSFVSLIVEPSSSLFFPFSHSLIIGYSTADHSLLGASAKIITKSLVILSERNGH
jgi:hypothetical protein